MQVYDWAAAAKPSWFIPDGIQHTPYGYAQRSRLIANALAHAFPRSQPRFPQMTPPQMTRMLPFDMTGGTAGPPPSCFVH